MTREQKRKDLIAGTAIVVLVIVLLGVAACVKAALRIDVQSTSKTTEAERTVYIVYTDEQGEIYAVPSEPKDAGFTRDEREWLAEILAGKAADRTEACQRMVATVLYNDVIDCGGDLDRAVRKYGLNDAGTPTDQIYKVVDAVFYDGEFMLDPEVLWFNDADHPSAFHDSLVYECECDGIAFYRAHRPAVVPGGEAE